MTHPVSVDKLIEAATLLELGTQTNLHEIRAHYHTLLKKWHPDTSHSTPEESHQMTVRLNEAYDLLVDYCMNYTFSFRPEDLKESVGKNPAEFWMERYGNDPIWN